MVSEQRYLVPIYTPLGNRSRAYLAVKVDAVVRDNFDNLWVMEHKTRGVSSRVDDPPGMILDLQMGLQVLCLRRVAAAQGLGNVKGVIYNLVRRQKPGPRVRAPIYGRHQVFRSEQELQILESFLYKTYRAMRQVKANGLVKARYNPQVWAGGYCTWGCPVMNICEALVRGSDVDYLLSVEFRERDRDIWQMLEDEMND